MNNWRSQTKGWQSPNNKFKFQPLHTDVSHSFTHQLCSAVHPVWKSFRPLSLPQLCSLSHSLNPLLLPPSNFLPLSSISCSPFCLLSTVGPGRNSSFQPSPWLCGKLAGHCCSSLLGKGSEKFCKWGEMTPLVSNLVSLVSKIRPKRVMHGRSRHCHRDRELIVLGKKEDLRIN